MHTGGARSARGAAGIRDCRGASLISDSDLLLKSKTSPLHPPPLPSPPSGISQAWRTTPPAGVRGPSPTSSAPSTMCPASSASALPRHTRDTSQVSGTHMPRMPVVGQEGNIPRAAYALPRHTRDTSHVGGTRGSSALIWQSAGHVPYTSLQPVPFQLRISPRAEVLLPPSPPSPLLNLSLCRPPGAGLCGAAQDV